jgi:hypothetical protein
VALADDDGVARVSFTAVARQLMAAAIDIPPGGAGSAVTVIAEHRREQGAITWFAEVASTHAVLVASFATRAGKGGVAPGDGEYVLWEKERLVASGKLLCGVVEGREGR